MKKINAHPIDPPPLPDRCPFCRAEPPMLERILGGYFCNQCSKTWEPARDV